MASGTPNLAPGYLTALKEMRSRSAEAAKDREWRAAQADKGFWRDTAMDIGKLGLQTGLGLWKDSKAESTASEKTAYDRAKGLADEGMYGFDEGDTSGIGTGMHAEGLDGADVGAVPWRPVRAADPEMRARSRRWPADDLSPVRAFGVNAPLPDTTPRQPMDIGTSAMPDVGQLNLKPDASVLREIMSYEDRAATVGQRDPFDESQRVARRSPSPDRPAVRDPVSSVPLQRRAPDRSTEPSPAPFDQPAAPSSLPSIGAVEPDKYPELVRLGSEMRRRRGLKEGQDATQAEWQRKNIDSQIENRGLTGYRTYESEQLKFQKAWDSNDVGALRASLRDGLRPMRLQEALEAQRIRVEDLDPRQQTMLRQNLPLSVRIPMNDAEKADAAARVGQDDRVLARRGRVPQPSTGGPKRPIPGVDPGLENIDVSTWSFAPSVLVYVPETLDAKGNKIPGSSAALRHMFKAVDRDWVAQRAQSLMDSANASKYLTEWNAYKTEKDPSHLAAMAAALDTGNKPFREARGGIVREASPGQAPAALEEKAAASEETNTRRDASDAGSRQATERAWRKAAIAETQATLQPSNRPGMYLMGKAKVPVSEAKRTVLEEKVPQGTKFPSELGELLRRHLETKERLRSQYILPVTSPPEGERVPGPGETFGTPRQPPSAAVQGLIERLRGMPLSARDKTKALLDAMERRGLA